MAPLEDAGAPDGTAQLASDAGTSDAGAPLSPGIYPLAGTDQTMPTDDLAPLLAIVGSASNVGLGESIHTSGGFEAMKARIVRFLVEEGGFRVLALETPRTNAMGITGRYVDTCAGTPQGAVQGMFPVFASDSMGALLAWMCEWNQTHPGDTVRFVGFDVQQPWTDWDALSTFLKTAAPDDAASLMNGVKTCDGTQAASEMDFELHHSGDPYSQTSFDACNHGLDAIDAYFTANAAAMTQRTASEAYTLATLSLLGLRSWQGEKFWDPVTSGGTAGATTDVVKSYEARDLAMARVYETLRSLYFPAKKAILWAHNYHLMKDHPAAGDAMGPQGARNMGSVLAQDLGDAYAPIGLSGWDVEINWGSVGQGAQPTPTSPKAVEWKLHDLGRPWLLVDLGDPGLASFLTPGATYTYGSPDEMDMVPAGQFCAAIYFGSSPPMKYLE